MAAAVAILDALRKKPVADKKRHFSVAFFVAPVKRKEQEAKQDRKLHTEPVTKTPTP